MLQVFTPGPRGKAHIHSEKLPVSLAEGKRALLVTELGIKESKRKRDLLFLLIESLHKKRGRGKSANQPFLNPSSYYYNYYYILLVSF